MKLIKFIIDAILTLLGILFVIAAIIVWLGFFGIIPQGEPTGERYEQEMQDPFTF